MSWNVMERKQAKEQEKESERKVFLLFFYFLYFVLHHAFWYCRILIHEPRRHFARKDFLRGRQGSQAPKDEYGMWSWCFSLPVFCLFLSAFAIYFIIIIYFFVALSMFSLLCLGERDSSRILRRKRLSFLPITQHELPRQAVSRCLGDGNDRLVDRTVRSIC